MVENFDTESVALQYLVSEAKETIDLMCSLSSKIRVKRDEGEDIFESAHCVKALKYYLISLVALMFDTYHKGGNDPVPSFKTANLFLRNSELKNIIGQIHGQRIIGKIIKVRHTFLAHIDPKHRESITIEEICTSNLRELFHKLENIRSLL